MVLESWKNSDVAASRCHNHSLHCLRSPGCIHNHLGWPWSHAKRQIASYPIWYLKQGGEAAFVKPGKGRPKVSSGPLRTVKNHNSSNVYIWRRWSTLIGCLGSRSCPTAVASSALDRFPFFWEGELHLSNLERVAPRWVLVLWGWSKYHNSSNVFI
jgi:hypothetical protein